MSNKKSKKRNKAYTGWDAKTDDSTVTVHKVSAVNRSPVKQWLHEHKKPVKIVSIAVGVIIIIVLAFAIQL
jgi:hypothetical protein